MAATVLMAAGAHASDTFSAGRHDSALAAYSSTEVRESRHVTSLPGEAGWEERQFVGYDHFQDGAYLEALEKMTAYDSGCVEVSAEYEHILMGPWKAVVTAQCPTADS
ncbi:hypothetical protein [Streptomyces sp. NPDC096030]|uniref:hypothetical protein n=1 Tax=Streptomyces sp. NPDC096030 TaxID=3155423 RepID=UPI003324D0E0